MDEMIQSLSSKLGKDEFYTFVVGFFLGLIYFLTVVTDTSELPHFKFYINDNYYLTLYLVAAWLLATLLNYILYLFLSLGVQKIFERKYKRKYPSGIPLNKSQMINRKALLGIQENYIHLFGIISSALLIFSSTYRFVFKFTHSFYYFSYFRTPLFITAILGCVMAFVFICLACIFSYPVYEISRALELNKYKSTYDEEKWCEHNNRIVDQLFESESSLS